MKWTFHAPTCPRMYETLLRIKWLHRIARFGARHARRTMVACERFRGFDFTSWMDEATLGYAGTENYPYQPWPARVTRSVLRTLAITSEDSIIDIGCGKGNALRVFASFPFREVAGLEVSPELCRIARSNMERLGISDRVAVYNQDATQFADYRRFTLFFMFNPFGPGVMRNVLSRIAAEPLPARGLRIVYANPVHETELLKMGARLEGRFHAPFSPPVHVYGWYGQAAAAGTRNRPATGNR